MTDEIVVVALVLWGIGVGVLGYYIGYRVGKHLP